MNNKFAKMKKQKFSFVYITTKNCNVCKVIQPRVRALAKDYKGAVFHLIELDDNKEASGFFMVFAVPTILVYSEDKELIRTGRHLNIDEMKMKLDRYYQMIFDDV
ncbi:MAG: thioredoxin family protein [Candidatus Marinimicrobia bacterium]|nr:thioredoxin family protein [Candidatus Neomarinimicrobiota bacterium]